MPLQRFKKVGPVNRRSNSGKGASPLGLIHPPAAFDREGQLRGHCIFSSVLQRLESFFLRYDLWHLLWQTWIECCKERLMVGVHLIRRFAVLEFPRQLLIVEAVLALAAAAVAVAFMRYRNTVRFGARPLPVGLRHPRGKIDEILWSVKAVSVRVPWRAMCFERGLALQYMLRRRGHDARLIYGARLNQDSDLDAHVWVKLDERILIGGETAPDFQHLAIHPE